MALLKALCWALIFIIRIRFPPGTSLATVLNVESVRNENNIDRWGNWGGLFYVITMS